MSTETTWICDRCGKRHTPVKPYGWQTSVVATLKADQLPTYSPYHVSKHFALVCDECMGIIAKAMNAILEPINVEQ